MYSVVANVFVHAVPGTLFTSFSSLSGFPIFTYSSYVLYDFYLLVLYSDLCEIKMK